MNAPIHGQHDDLAAEQGDLLLDRRRPGRKDVHPSLIPLLRNQTPILVVTESSAADVQDTTPGLQFPVRDDMSAPVGIARGLGIMGVAWVGVALLAFHLAH